MKREILYEMAADLESLADRLRSDGLAAADADREAIRRLGLGEDASVALADLHLAPLERGIRRTASLARTGRDLMLISAGIFLVLSPLPILARTADLWAVVAHLWPIGVLLLVALWSAAQAASLLRAPRLDHPRAWDCLTRLLVAAILTFSVTALIAVLHVFSEARGRVASIEPLGTGLFDVAAGASLRLAIGMAVGLAVLAIRSVSASRLTGRIQSEAPASEIFHSPARRDR